MLHAYLRRFGCLVVAILVLSAVTAQAHDQRYRYLYRSIAQPMLPSGITFFDPIAIIDSGHVYGMAYDDTGNHYVAVYKHGVVEVLRAGSVVTANQRGTVGGSVPLEPAAEFEHAALIDRKKVEIIPPQPGELSSAVVALNDHGVALVRSDLEYPPTFILYEKGQSTPLYFDPTFSRVRRLHLNNGGIVSGTTSILGLGDRGFRYGTRTGETTQLDPLPTEPHSWAMDINNRGLVLGYSTIFGAIERIGVWDRRGRFHTHFVQGTAEYPTISNSLLFNDNNLVVVTQVSRPESETSNSYLIPKPGVRLNLAKLVKNLPSGIATNFIIDINNHGDVIGYSLQQWVLKDIFVLKRTGTGRRGHYR